jgi:integrase
MATYRKRGNKWEAAVCIDGVRRSASFPSKREAVEWAATQTVAIKTVQAGGIPDVPVSVLLERYMMEVTPRKRSADNETRVIKRLMRDDVAAIRLPILKPAHLAAWRDRRLTEVKPGSVLRDWSILSHAFTIAKREWGYHTENPLISVQPPKSPPHRERLILEAEIAQILLALGYSREGEAKTARARVAVVFLFAIETAMRRGEILSLNWDNIRGNVAHLSMTKNGFPRNVPLSPEALRLLNQLPKNGDSVFNLNKDSLRNYFNQARKRAQIVDLHFHDTRHEAITRLARKLNVLALQRMVGIREINILKVYYNETPEQIAAMLAC